MADIQKLSDLINFANDSELLERRRDKQLSSDELPQLMQAISFAQALASEVLPNSDYSRFQSLLRALGREIALIDRGIPSVPLGVAAVQGRENLHPWHQNYKNVCIASIKLFMDVPTYDDKKATTEVLKLMHKVGRTVTRKTLNTWRNTLLESEQVNNLYANLLETLGGKDSIRHKEHVSGACFVLLHESDQLISEETTKRKSR